MTKTKNAPKKSEDKSKFKKDLAQVQDQYLDYPYPFRNPEDDKTRLMRMQGDFLCEISHFLYKGKQTFKNGFRVLVAGGGTGDSTVWLGKQLMEYPNTEVVYLDFSKASMAIAKKRAEYQGVTNITWIEDSILNIPDLNLGKFDFINCIGVLHHLKDPDLGLKILSDSLKDDGGMSIMVYGQYGRTGLYHIQKLMQMINQGVTNRQEEVKHCWNVVNSLPDSNWYNRGADLLADHKFHGDIGLYDMFLHKQDRAYTIPELYEFVEKAGMNLTSFVDPYTKACLNIDSYFAQSETKERIKQLDLKTQQAICEIMCGNIIKHAVHLSKKKDTIADLTDLDNIPYIFNAPDLCKDIVNLIETRPNEVMNRIVTFNVSDFMKRQMSINLAILPLTKYFFKYMADGTMSLREIFEATRAESKSNVTNEQMLQEFGVNLNSLITVGSLFLRDKSIPPYNIFRELGQ